MFYYSSPLAKGTMRENWFDHSPDGSPSLLSDSSCLQKIYEKLNLKTNSEYPNIQLSLKEEAMMRLFYHTKIRDICGALEYSLMVEYDAHVLLHKYFLRHGILDHDAKHAM